MFPTSYHSIFEDEWNELKSRISFATTYHENWHLLIPLFEQISLQSCVFIMIWDMLKNRIIYHTDKRGIIDYPSSKYLAEDGVDFTMSNVHPEFIESLVKQQKCAIKYFTNALDGGVKQVVTNLESVSRKNNGKYFHLLQQTVAVELDSRGNPFLFLTYVYDITHIKKDRTINMVITMPNQILFWNFNFAKKSLDFLKPLSKQEKIILSCLAEGKSSKQISSELFISSMTVDTHRKNLLRKTNCVDTTGMITYARLVGLI